MPELKVTADHLKRDAYLYVRQSTLRQVAEHGESTQRQYALRDRAIATGWPIERIHVIDRDLGKSGSSTTARDGFQQLVSEVALGKAGIVMGLEVSRLARNSADWHRLIELCALTATLILDEDGIYDPAGFNDRLLLGLKGTMSEAELHILKARMRGGQLNKARRGELEMGPPVGLVYRTDGTIGLDPDAQVQNAIRLVFESSGPEVPSRRSAFSGSKVCSSHADCGRVPAKVTSCGRHRSIHASCKCCTIRATLELSSMGVRAHATGPMAEPVSSRFLERTGSSSCRACTRVTSTGNGRGWRQDQA
jgi:DNA invertase Pin-like site-specific DNA recombinase